MSATAVDQFIPTLASRDAIGSHTLEVQTVLRQMGLSSEIFSSDVHDELSGAAHPYRHYGRVRGRRTGWLLYQASIGSPVADYVANRPEPKLLNYHNITPARFLEAWDPAVGDEVANGRRQLGRLAPRVEAAIAVSSYNRNELVGAGYRRVAVAPVVVDLDAFDRAADPEVLSRLGEARSAGGADWLFVGRVLPHKAHHDVITAFHLYRQVYDPSARLHLVGAVGFESYDRALRDLIAALGLDRAVELTGSISSAALASYYRSADVFVCCSDHEGFCVPLLEAMHHGVPVVAYGAAAVPETVGEAGVVLSSKKPSVVAAAVQRVLDDAQLRQALAEVGRARLADFAPGVARERLRRAVEDALGGGGAGAGT